MCRCSEQGRGDSGDDVIYGNSGIDFINGNLGDDLIHGGAGGDTLRGGMGDDTIRGDHGDDILHGDKGSDILDGGPGNDTYVYASGNESVTIKDTSGAADSLRCEGVTVASSSYQGSDLVLKMADGGQIRIVGHKGGGAVEDLSQCP